MKYNYLKLLRAQYSWKNDRTTFYINLALSLLISLVYILFGSVEVTINEVTQPVSIFSKVTAILWMIWFGILMTFHHTIKFILLGVILCGAVTYYANFGDEGDKEEARDRYLEMMTWRK